MSSKPSHFPALDGLRGLAILMVLCHNGLMLDGSNVTLPGRLTQYVLNQGWIGVLLFFVLSGFLITGILLDTAGQAHALRNFVARRALRIFPLYYGTLLVLFVLLPLIGMQPEAYKIEAGYQVWLWTYTVNWTMAMGLDPGALPHFWSLAVEEQFYLFWPLLVFALRTPSRVAQACLVVTAMGVGCRAWMLHAGLDPNAVYEMTTSRLDALALGGLGAACWRVPAVAQWLRTHAVMLLAAVLVFFLGSAVLTHGFPRASFSGMVLGYLALAVLFAAAVYVGAWQDSHPGPQNRPAALWHRALTCYPLQQVGKYSYGMYVFHKLVHDQLAARIMASMSGWASNMMASCLYIVVLTAMTYGAAWLSYNLFEVRFLQLKRHFA